MMKKKIILTLIITMMLASNSAIANGVGIGELNTDWTFNEERTLYYVTTDRLPDISEEGYTVIKNATAFYDGGALSEDYVTVLENDTTKKKYRFIMQKKASGTSGIANVDISSDGKAVVMGSVEGYDVVEVMILKPKEEYSDFAWELKDVDMSNMKDKVLDFIQIKASDIKDGKILEYQIPEGAPCGTYNFVLVTGGKNTVSSKYYINQDELDKTLVEINNMVKNPDKTSELKAYIEENWKKCYLELSEYNKLSYEASKSKVIALLHNTEGFESLDDLKEKFNENIIVGRAIDGKEISELLERYKEAFGKTYIEPAKYEEYKALSDKTLLIEALKSVSDIQELEEKFNEMTVLSKINEADPSDVEKILNDDIDYLKISKDAAEYFNNNKEACIKNIRGKAFKSSEELSGAILAVKDAEGKEPEGSTTGKKPSSGKPSGGGGGGYVAPITTTPAPPKNEVSVTPEMTSGLPFDDIGDVEWAHVAIEHLYDNKILNGKSETKFAPKDYVKREEFVKLVVNAFELSGSDSISFSDVPEDAWYSEFVKIAFKNEIVKGVSESQFGVGENITREDMAVMIERAVKAMGKDTDIIVENKVELNDLDTVSDYAKEAVDFMIEKGAVKGSDGLFRPKAYATRAETAQMLYNIIKIR